MLFDYGKNYGLLIGINKKNFLRLYHGFTKWKIIIKIFNKTLISNQQEIKYHG